MRTNYNLLGFTNTGLPWIRSGKGSGFMAERFVDWEGVPCVIDDKSFKVFRMKGFKRIEVTDSRNRWAIRNNSDEISEVKAKDMAGWYD